MATHSSISNGKSHGQRGWLATVHGVLRVGQERLNHTTLLSHDFLSFYSACEHGKKLAHRITIYLLSTGVGGRPGCEC